MFKRKKCTEEELYDIKEKFKLNLSWYFNEDIYLIYKNNNPIALIEIDLNNVYMPEGYYMIYNFEVFYKSKGFGSEVIKYILQCESKRLCLYANDLKSKKFWEKNGFIGSNDGTGSIMHFYHKIK